MTTKVLAVVPLRLASARIPRKVLTDIAGESLSRRTLARARAAFAGDAEITLLAAVDSPETQAHLEEAYPDLGVILTDPALPSGTDRVFAATQAWIAAEPSRKAELRGVINIQGDMPFAGVQGLKDAANFYKVATPDELVRFPMLTLAQDWPADTDFAHIGAVKVISDREGGAIYFSRHPIPHSMRPFKGKASAENLPVSRLHIGVYGYTLETLALLAAQAPVELERAEMLEQLRALWMGLRILVIATDPGPGSSFRGIDTPLDLAWAKRFARAGGAPAAKPAKPAMKKTSSAKSAQKKPKGASKKSPAKKQRTSRR